MIQRNVLTFEERHALERCCASPRRGAWDRARANAILLLDKGQSYFEIAAFLYLDDDTVRGWYKA